MYTSINVYAINYCFLYKLHLCVFVRDLILGWRKIMNTCYQQYMRRIFLNGKKRKSFSCSNDGTEIWSQDHFQNIFDWNLVLSQEASVSHLSLISAKICRTVLIWPDPSSIIRRQNGRHCDLTILNSLSFISLTQFICLCAFLPILMT